MNDPSNNDEQIRQLMNRVVDESPPPPAIDLSGVNRIPAGDSAVLTYSRRPSQRALALAAAVVLLVGAAIATTMARGPLSTEVDTGSPVATQPVTATSTTLLPNSGDPLVTCGLGGVFASSALNGPAGAELGDDPAAIALRDYLEHGRPGSTGASEPTVVKPSESSTVPSSSEAARPADQVTSTAVEPDTGWRLLSRDDHHALFSRGVPPTLDMVHVDENAGVWAVGLSGRGECRPTLVLAGFAGLNWAVDPSFALAPDSSVVHLLVTERPCSGTVGDTRPPEVREDTDRVVILLTVATANPDGRTGMCPLRTPSPVTVDLGGPLAGRMLFDGAFYPALPVR